MDGPIHIIEPTLRDQTGHCYSHVTSLTRANRQLGYELEIWGGRSAVDLGLQEPHVTVHGHYWRPLRRLQSPLLYRRLMARPGRLYWPTGNRTELSLLDVGLGGKRVPPAKVFMLFHWLKLSEAKQAWMRRLAEKHPELVMMSPTAGVMAGLEACGFKRCHVVPYPISPAPPPAGESGFRCLLFAGAARADKGFEHVVALVRHLHETGSDLPLVMQVSTPHGGVHEPRVEAALTELRGIGYAHLEWVTRTLDETEYRDLFRGAICLQPYDRDEYAGDRISGVTLDAFSNGSPILTTSRTWMGGLVERFQAGVALDSFEPESMASAVDRLRREFPAWRQRAVKAGVTLQDENDGGRLLRFIADYA